MTGEKLSRAQLSEIQRAVVREFETPIPAIVLREVKRLDFLASTLPTFSSKEDEQNEFL
ncbi:MAG: hypothetical protein HXS54_01260 [Theionarchaea archaeon]|nr:hypothetical protein [Theionarchaea archaeon]